MADTLTPAPPDAPRHAADGRSAAPDGPVKPVGPRAASQAEAALVHEMVPAYVPQMPLSSVHAESVSAWNWQFYGDIDAMQMFDVIKQPLAHKAAVVLGVEVKAEANTPDVANYVAAEWQWFLANVLPRIYKPGCAYGWDAGELTYRLRDGLLRQDSFRAFSPRDVRPLLRDEKPVGVRVQSHKGGKRAQVDLWAFRKDVPNKAFWYSHCPAHGERFGESVLRAAWLPWRSLYGRDGAYEMLALAQYRGATGVSKIYFPPDGRDIQTGVSPNGTTRFSNREMARQMNEQIRAGSGIMLPAIFDGQGNKLWDHEFDQAATNIPEILSVIDFYERSCSKAIGVPPEIFQAAEGTGLSQGGRDIPLQAFLSDQQPEVQHIVRLWVEQVGEPLVRWNFGPKAFCRLTPKPLIESYRKAEQAQPGAGPVAPSPDAGMVGMSTEAALAAELPGMTLREMYALRDAMELAEVEEPYR